MVYLQKHRKLGRVKSTWTIEATDSAFMFSELAATTVVAGRGAVAAGTAGTVVETDAAGEGGDFAEGCTTCAVAAIFLRAFAFPFNRELINTR